MEIKTAWLLVTKLKQSESSFLAFADAGGICNRSTASKLICYSFPK